LAEVLQAALDSFRGQLHVAMPGIVVSYDEAKQKANVQPQVKSLIIDQDGNEESLSLPELPSVPVVFPRGGGFFVSFPLQPGDQVLLVVCDRELNVWKSKGGNTTPQDPRTHHLADAVAIPGCYPFTDVLADAHASNMVLGKDGGAQVHVKADEIDLYEENAADFVALATDVKGELDAVKADLDALKTALAAHTHIGVTVGTASSGVSTGFATWTPHTPGSVAATKVKAT
jgi:hypothetical protein